MGQVTEQVFFQRTHRVDQYAHEKMLNVLIIKEMQIKTTMSYLSPHTVRMATVEKTRNNKCWRGCEGKEILFACSFALGLHSCAHAFSSRLWKPLFVAVQGLIFAVAFPAVEYRLQVIEAAAMAHGLVCSKACGIFLDQGSNPCNEQWILNHWTTREVQRKGNSCTVLLEM